MSDCSSDLSMGYSSESSNDSNYTDQIITYGKHLCKKGKNATIGQIESYRTQVLKGKQSDDIPSQEKTGDTLQNMLQKHLQNCDEFSSNFKVEKVKPISIKVDKQSEIQPKPKKKFEFKKLFASIDNAINTADPQTDGAKDILKKIK